MSGTAVLFVYMVNGRQSKSVVFWEDSEEMKIPPLIVYKTMELKGVSVCADPAALVTAGAGDPGVSGKRPSQQPWPGCTPGCA